MSKLTEKINSYPIEKGIVFGQSLSIPEPETGTYPQTTAGEWTTSGVAGELSISGPKGQEPDEFDYRSSSKFTMSAANRARLNISSTNWGQAFVDHNWSMGFWFKLNPYTYVPDSQLSIFVLNTLTAGGFQIFSPTNSSGFPQSQILVLSYTQSPTFTILTNPDTGFDEYEIGKWYYIALIRQGTTITVYINGKLVATVPNFASGALTGVTFGSTIASGTSPDYRGFNISNFYVASPSVIGATQIEEIWNAGNSAEIINYYDGSSWEQAYASTVWDGTKWALNTNTKYYNGTAWVDTPEYDQTNV